MEIRQLKLFLEILTRGSISQAAKAANISQPALSHSIKMLEQSVGAELLTRGAQGVQPTKIGLEFAKYARVILRESEKALEEVSSMRGGESRVDIGLHSAFTMFMAPSVLAEARRRFPKVKLEVSVATFSWGDVQQSLREGNWDFAVIMGPREIYPSDFIVEPLLKLKSETYCSPDHPLAKKSSIGLSDLAQCSWAVTRLGFMETQFAQAFAGETQKPDIHIRTDSMDLIRLLTRDHGFVSRMPSRMADADVAAGKLVKIEESFLESESQIIIIYSALLQRTSAINAIMSVFREYSGKT